MYLCTFNYFIDCFFISLVLGFKYRGQISRRIKCLSTNYDCPGDPSGELCDSLAVQPFGRYFMNSVIVTPTVVGMTFSSAVVAYGFARFEFKGREFLFLLVLSTMMIPWDVLVIPLYMQYNFFGWLDTLKPLIVPAYFGGAFYIFLMRQFLRGIPADMTESALIDGANHWQIFVKIFLPILRPQLALTAIMYMMVVWNDYLGPLVYISDFNKFTWPIGLSLFKGAYTTDYTSLMAITVVMTIPTIIAFFLGQKQILDMNVTAGLKG